MTTNFCFSEIPQKSVRFGGPLGTLLQNITEHWLIGIRETNPAILDMIADADYLPHRHLLAWSGEFAGKYLTCATQLYRLTRDVRLGDYLTGFTQELLSLQQPDGYLGVFSEGHRLTGTCAPMQYAFDANAKPETLATWDSWAHYHIMLGLLLWHDTTGDEQAFQAVVRIAELYLSTFYGAGQPRVVDTGSEEMNLSVLHSFAILYRKTGDARYLRFCERLVADLEVPPAGDYLRQALNGVEFWQMPKPRWESLHPIEGLLELYAATGDAHYRRAVEHIWWSIVSTDVHNTGGFSTWEQAMGSPYKEGPIETCCVIAFMALSADVLRLSGKSIVADTLELATLNSSMGSFSPSGRWSTYDTPVAGCKRANYQQIVFQSRAGSPDLNCCSVNAPRAFGLLDSWAFMAQGDAAVVNYYGACSAVLELPAGCLSFTQETQYPYDGTVTLCIEQAPQTELTLKLRIPFWSEQTLLTVNGEPVAAQKGSYAAVTRVFRPGDRLCLTLDMSLHIWVGEERLSQLASLYYGPLLLCADAFYDRRLDVEHLPGLDAASLRVTGIEQTPRAGCLFRVSDGKQAMVLCDLYTAGSSGSNYTSWLPMRAPAPVPFTKENPFRLQRIG